MFLQTNYFLALELFIFSIKNTGSENRIIKKYLVNMKIFRIFSDVNNIE